MPPTGGNAELKLCLWSRFGMGELIAVVLIVGYAAGAWKFWRGFRRTTFSQSLSNRVTLSLLWPALFIANKSYRQNFKKALKG
jgi:hypothetical protein